MIRRLIIPGLLLTTAFSAPTTGASRILPAQANRLHYYPKPAQLGDLICRFTYDGLGRLIRKETPVSEGPTALQKKEFYYDGVRRIQEVIFRPDLLIENLESGAFLTDGNTANDEAPVELETPGGLDPGQEIVDDVPMSANRPGPPPPPPPTHWTDREYTPGAARAQTVGRSVTARCSAARVMRRETAEPPKKVSLVRETFCSRSV